MVTASLLQALPTPLRFYFRYSQADSLDQPGDHSVFIALKVYSLRNISASPQWPLPGLSINTKGVGMAASIKSKSADWITAFSPRRNLPKVRVDL